MHNFGGGACRNAGTELPVRRVTVAHIAHPRKWCAVSAEGSAALSTDRES